MSALGPQHERAWCERCGESHAAIDGHRLAVAQPITGGPGGVGVGSIVRRVSDGREAVVVAFDPPTCGTFVTWVASTGKANTLLIDTCDYDGKPCKPWEVVRAVEPYRTSPVLPEGDAS